MQRRELQQMVELGEDSSRQFKAELTNPDSLAAELVAFSNSKGGTIVIGVADDGTLVGLSPQDVRRINQLIGNAATQAVRSPVSPRTENVSIGKQRTVVVVTVPEGLDKPYFDRNGVIWLKAGADKRRVQSKEELRRLFQDVDLLQADQVPTSAGIDHLDRLRFRDFLSGTYREVMPEDHDALARLLENMNLAQSGHLNALVHRDYFVQAPVRLFMLDNRVEIISPGNLPNHLTVEKIRAGNSVIRNPVLASFAAKGVLPYRGLGTGIRRALAEWPAVDLLDDRDACTFTATVRLSTAKNAPITTGNAPINAPINAPLTDLQRSMLTLIAADPSISYDTIAAALGRDRTTVMRNIRALKARATLRREGSRKTGHWVVVDGL